MATVDGLKSLKRPEEVAKLRGKEIREVIKPHSEALAEAEAAVAAAAVEAERDRRGGRTGARRLAPPAKPKRPSKRPAPRRQAPPRPRRSPSPPPAPRKRAAKPTPAPEAAAEPEAEAAPEPAAEAEEAEDVLMASSASPRCGARSARSPSTRARCGRSGCARSTRSTVRDDSPVLQGMLRKVAIWSAWRRSMADETPGPTLHELKPAPGQPPRAQADRPRPRLRQRQDLRPRPEGPEVAVGQPQHAAPASRAARCRSTCGSASCAAPTTRSRCPWARSARAPRP